MQGFMIEMYEDILGSGDMGENTMHQTTKPYGKGQYTYEVGWITSPLTQSIGANSEAEAKQRFLNMYHSGRIGKVTAKKVLSV